MAHLPRDPLKPHLLNSTLFAKNIPGAIKDEEIYRIFEDFEVFRFQNTQTTNTREPTPGGGSGKRNRKRKGKGGPRVVQVEFASIAAAEKAFAVLNLRVFIPGTEPAALLELSLTLDESSINNSTGNPRVVKSLPSFCETDVQLYTFIRPFGPLASARMDHVLGGLVQFWSEDDACAAEEAIRATFNLSPKVTLQACDPCGIFCTDLCPEVEEGSLRALFEPFGTIVSFRFMRAKKGRKRGYGFVTFESPSEASEAIYALRGTTIGSDPLQLHYSELRVTRKPTTNPAFKKTETPNTDKLASNVSQPPQWGGSDKSSNDTAVNGSDDCETEAKPNHDDSQQYKKELDRLRAELTESLNLRSSERDETENLRLQVKRLEEQVSGLNATLREAELDREALRVKCEEWRRKFTVTDSRLKIVELESDRPLWEEARKKREMKEKEETEKAEKARREAELLESERKMRELLEQEKKRKLEEKARKEREEAQRKARERAIAEEKEREKERVRAEALRLKNWKEATQTEQLRCHARDIKLWGDVINWAKKHALDRVTIISAEFGQTKFSEALPLTFGNIPWPVLEDPMTLDVDDITWNNVEAFFVYAKATKETDMYNKFIETIHRLFHPDKWRARRALESVMDPSLRDSLEKAGNIVSQAITPLWRDTKNTA